MPSKKFLENWKPGRITHIVVFPKRMFRHAEEANRKEFGFSRIEEAKDGSGKLIAIP